MITAFVTVVTGTLVFVLGQMIVSGAITPALKLKRLVGTIAFDLDFYANQLFEGSTMENEWRRTFRKHACSLREKLTVIVWYRVFAFLLRMPPANDVLMASFKMMSHSNQSTKPGFQNSQEDEIKRLLRIKTSPSDLVVEKRNDAERSASATSARP